MEIIFTTIIPLLVIGGAGYISVVTKVFSIETAEHLNKILFTVCVPVLLFRLIVTIDFDTGPSLYYIATYYGIAIILFFIHQISAKFLFKREHKSIPIFAFTSIFGNSVSVGLPAMIFLLGEEKSYPYVIIISFHALILVTFCTIVTECYQSNKEKSLRGFFLSTIIKNIWTSLYKNTLLIGLFLGAIYRIAGFEWVPVLENIAKPLGYAALPLALFSMGMVLTQYKIMGQIYQSCYITISKLLVFPLCVYLCMHYIVQFPPIWVLCATFCAALPCGTNAYIFAHYYKIGERMATTSIFITTLLSLITLSCLIVLLRP